MLVGALGAGDAGESAAIAALPRAERPDPAVEAATESAAMESGTD